MDLLAPRQWLEAQRVVEALERLRALLARPWTAPMANGLALVLLTSSLARWTWVLLAPTTLPTAAAAPGARGATVDIHVLTGAQLFGAAPVTAGTSVDPNSVPLSSLNLVLTGIVAAGKVSMALISVDGHPQEPFVLGQTITQGAVLQAVYPDRVILQRGGLSESLLLEGAVRPLSESEVAVGREVARASGAATGIRQAAPDSFVVSKQTLNQQLAAPQQLLSQALMEPAPGGGFAVREIQSGSVYEQLGLKVGDVIRSANGYPMNSVAEAMSVYQRLNAQRQIQLEVIRDGRPQVLQYQIR